MLAAGSALASVLTTEVHSVAFGIMAGCATFVAGAEAWYSYTRGNQKNDHCPHVVTKKKFHHVKILGTYLHMPGECLAASLACALNRNPGYVKILRAYLDS